MNSGGQAGIGSTVSDITTPQWVNLGVGRTAIAVSAGGQHTCAILDNGEMKCWGQDYNGALGNGVGTSSYTIPQTVPGGFTWNTSTGSNSGGSSSNYALTPSVEGADLFIDEAMTNITFQYNAGAASGSGSGSTSSTCVGTACMVKDINASGDGVYSPLHTVGNTIYFRGVDGTNGMELWKSDGTTSGTMMVKDIWSGSNGGLLWNGSLVGWPYVNISNTLYFAANDGTNGYELWKTDGTASGTVMVKDINSGSGSSFPGSLYAVGNTLYFRADDGTNGNELWKSDGTASGTVMVKDIWSGSPSSWIYHPTSIGNTLYFTATDGTGIELWKSDGTTSGTVMVKDINTSSISGNGNSVPTWLTVIGNTLYFSANDGTNGAELWKTDGTTSGTVMVKDINGGSGSSNPICLTAIGNTLYFNAYDQTNGAELWKSDGTTSGTVMVKDIGSGSSSGNPTCSGMSMPVLGSTLYFTADDGTNGNELWKSDGTASGTVMVKDINASGSSNSYAHTVIGNTLYFWADDGTNGYELWISDGTASGTEMVENIRPGNTGYPVLGGIAGINNGVYFMADDGTNGWELWTLGSGGSMTDVTGASCSISPSLPAGLSIDSSTCTISGTPTVETSNTTYTVTAVISGVTYQTTVWLSSSYLELTPSVEGADLYLDVPMTNVTFEYDVSAASGSSSGSGSGSSTSSAFAYGNNKLDVGDYHTCAIVDNGDLKCWGYNDNGRLGNGNLGSGSTYDLDAPSSTAIDLGTGRTAVAVSAGGSHTCAVLDNGSAKCWGANGWGQLGTGTSGPTASPAFVDINPSAASSGSHSGRTAVAVSAGGAHSCALLNDGGVMCWGMESGSGKGGSGSTSWTTPYQVLTGYNSTGGYWYQPAIAVSAGGVHSCVILNDGSVTCWGLGTSGQLGLPSAPSSPAAATSLWGAQPDLGTGRTAIAIAAGYTHTCAILDNGDLKCWGSNTYGQLGDGTTTNRNEPTLVSSLGTGRTAVAVSAGWYHTCAILDNGDAKCWGRDHHGQLGDGGSNTDLSAPPSNAIDLGTNRTAVAISSGERFTCAILENSEAKCWGQDAQGQLGDGGSNTDQGSPVSVSGSNTWDSSTGLIIGVTGASCSISPSLPTGLSIDSSTCTISGSPTAETSNTTYTVTAVISNVTYQGSVWLSTSAYGNITSAVDGAALNLGEAMTPITLNYTVNANVSNSSGSSGGTGGSSGSGSGSGSSALNTSSFVYANDKVSLGDALSCGILDNGELKCWGYDHRGALGDGGTTNTNTDAPSSTAIDLGTGRTAVAVSAGHYHVCAILDNGDLKCWGNDLDGQLGDGGSNTDTNAPSSNAIDLGPGRTAVEVSAGSGVTCAILDNGDLKCWGDNWYGQVGNGGGRGDVTSPPSTAINLGTGRTAVAVSAGADFVCALNDIGEVRCWGTDESGQLGYGASTTMSGYTNSPGAAIDLTGIVSDGDSGVAVALATGERHSCAILDSGDLKCWGAGLHGQLGNGNSSTNVYSPSAIAIDLGTGRTAVAVDAGGDVTCAILDNGDLKCWGEDYYGGLGNGGTNTNTNTPTSVDLGTGRTAVAVSVGWFHTCAILDNGDMKCWGRDNQGQLGDGGSNTDQGSPVSVTGSNSWDTTTTLVTWETHPALPAGMSISAGTISGTPSVYAKNQTYTIYANQSGYSTTHELYFSVDTDNAHTVVENQTIDPIGFHPPFNNGTTCWSVSPALPGNLSIDSSTGEITGSVNGTLTNTTYTVTANHGCTGSGTGGGSGNGSTWNALDLYGSQNGKVGMTMFLAIGDTIYFDGFDGGVYPGTPKSTMWAYDTSNGSAWQLTGVTSSDFGPGYHGMTMVVGDTIYFSNSEYGTTGNELWAHDTSNGSSWRVADLNSGSGDSNPGRILSILVGDTIYFNAECGNTCGNELWAHDTSNHSTWLAADIATGSGWGNPGSAMYHLIGDTLYFDAFTSSHGRELWAHDTSNHSTWQVADIWAGSAESYPGYGMSVVDGDILYFDARDANGFSIYAHNTTNGSTWPVHTLSTTGSNPLTTSVIKKTVGDAYYTSYNDPSTGIELWAFGFTNQSMWQVADIRSGSLGSSSWNTQQHCCWRHALFRCE